jgi:hypothetical protein
MDSSSLRGRSHNEHNVGSVETNKRQRVRQTEPVINSYDSDEAPLSIAESSGQTLTSITVSGSSLPGRDEDGSVTVDISNVMTTKIIDKRPSSSGFEYRCELGPLWLSSDLVGKTQMGGVQIRSYENGLIRAGRLGTLRERKRKHSQM